MTKTFDEVILGVRTAKKGVEVREDLAQMGEYCKEFTDNAGQRADAARDEAQGYAEDAEKSKQEAAQTVQGIDQTKADAIAAVQQAQADATKAVKDKQTDAESAVNQTKADAVQAVGDAKTAALQEVAVSTKDAANAALDANASKEAAAGSASTALNAAGASSKSAAAASGSAGAAATSESNAAASAESSKASADRAKVAAGKAEAIVNADKTLSIPGAPADAAAVGNIILDFTKETPQPIFYSKAEVDKLLEDCKEAAKRAALLAANPVGKLWASNDPTSPASIVGGTWEQIKDRFILAAGDTYAAGSTGGEAEHTLTINEMPAHRHIEKMQASNNGIATIVIRKSKGDTSGMSGYAQNDWLENSLRLSTDSAGRDVAHNNMPPYIAMYVWKRIA